ncbi:hypothetical protein D5067_0023645 (plasmid) [Enterobacter huaxiensis]|nr:hypothetical protein D5067_0023645 [Enterobacter huaxiensis]
MEYCCLLFPVAKANRQDIWLPFGSPSVPAGSSAPLRQTAAGAPASLRRTPSGFGLRYGLMADVNTTACSDRSGQAAFTAPAVNHRCSTVRPAIRQRRFTFRRVCILPPSGEPPPVGSARRA